MKPQQKAKKFKASIGERVETPCGVGTVLFRGKTDFADGEWVGVELDEPGERRLNPHLICQTQPNVYSLVLMLQNAQAASTTAKSRGSDISRPLLDAGSSCGLPHCRRNHLYYTIASKLSNSIERKRLIVEVA